jgi:purine catabolism regulator
MAVSLDVMLAHGELRLRLIWADAVARARPWGWAHSSDLDDPTPFLSDGDVLLTTGTQWSHDDDIEPWVARLAASGMPAVGFGTEVIRDGTPDALADACARHGVALFEVPYKTPFIAVARTVADLQAEERYARVRWTLNTQRAIAVTALKPAGIGAVVAELSRRIGAETGLIDPTGGSLGTVPPPAVVEEALSMLRTGRRAARAADGWKLQTVGAATALTGVLAIGPGSVNDEAERAVVTSVVALAGVSGADSGSGVAGRSGMDARTDDGGASAPAASSTAAEAAARLATLRAALQAALIASEPLETPVPAALKPVVQARFLEPLREHDAQGSDDLIGTLSTWLGCDAVAEAAAARLGIHRHTVRSRLKRAGELLDRDLDSFAARAEVYNALQSIGRA